MLGQDSTVLNSYNGERRKSARCVIVRWAVRSLLKSQMATKSFYCATFRLRLLFR